MVNEQTATVIGHAREGKAAALENERQWEVKWTEAVKGEEAVHAKDAAEDGLRALQSFGRSRRRARARRQALTPQRNG
jgi:hypothetical protein